MEAQPKPSETRNRPCRAWADFDSELQRIRNFEKVIGSSLTIYRGQADSEWPLQSMLERRFDRIQKAGLWEQYHLQRDIADVQYRAALNNHLKIFKSLARSNVGANLTDDEWWALGRHHGLWTPFLDWTRNPDVAAYFSFREDSHAKSESVAIWALTLPKALPRDFRVIEDKPPSRYGARQAAQEALFTLLTSQIFVDVEQYLRNEFQTAWLLRRITIPKSETTFALRSLANRGIDAQSTLVGTSSKYLATLDAFAKIANQSFVSFSREPGHCTQGI